MITTGKKLKESTSAARQAAPFESSGNHLRMLLFVCRFFFRWYIFLTVVKKTKCGALAGLLDCCYCVLPAPGLAANKRLNISGTVILATKQLRSHQISSDWWRACGRPLGSKCSRRSNKAGEFTLHTSNPVVKRRILCMRTCCVACSLILCPYVFVFLLSSVFRHVLV